jgi:carboxypeptidase Q
MVRRPLKFTVLIALALTLAVTATSQTSWLAPDSATINKFEDEGLQHSHVMEVMGYLADVYGPRLTNSPNIREAATYAVKTLGSWGLANVHEEAWGRLGGAGPMNCSRPMKLRPGIFR